MTSRRSVLAGVGTVALLGSAGCTSIADWIAGAALGDVNVFNETDAVHRGTIEIVASDNGSVLTETFELTPSQEDTEETEETDSGQNVVSYDDVWDGAGTYEASVTLDDTDVQGDSEGTESISIDNPEEEMLAVVFGADAFDDGIAFTVGEEWSEFERE